MSRALLVLMQGPEWTAVLGVFHGTVDGRTARARAVALRDALLARSPQAMQRVPTTYRTDTFLGLSTITVEELRFE